MRLGELLGISTRLVLAPHHAYASTPDALAVLDEFRDTVKALHRAGIEVILDVVYNHASEGPHDGPIFEFSNTLGRAVTADDIEPVNWVLVEQAQRLTAVDYAAAQAAQWAFRRQLQQWWAHGWDLLLTPTLAEPPPLTEFDNDTEHPTAPMRRAARLAAFTPPLNMSGQPAISLP